MKTKSDGRTARPPGEYARLSYRGLCPRTPALPAWIHLGGNT